MMEKTESNNGLFEVFNSPGKGLGLKATKNLVPGEAVLTESSLAHVLCNPERGRKCDFCLKDASSLHRCSNCKFMYYCGTPCQKKDWTVHKQECKCLVKVQPKRPPDICLLASRLILKLSKMNTESRAKKLSQIAEYHKIVTQNNDVMDAKRKEMFFTFAFVLHQFVDEKAFHKLNFTPSHTFGLLYWLSCNCFSILNDEMVSVGIGAYYNASLINHSCKSNCVAVFEASAISIRSLMNIKQGEEITICYIESLQTTEERRQELSDRYFFQCHCSLCDKESAKVKPNTTVRDSSLRQHSLISNGFDNNSTSSIGPEIENQAMEEEESNLKSALTKFKESISMTSLKSFETTISNYSKLTPEKSILLAKCYESLFYSCIQLRQWELAAKHGEALLELHLEFLGEIDPLTGIHLYLLGKIHRNLGRIRDGFDYLERAKQVLLITHGRQHRLTKELEALLAETSAEISYTRNNNNGIVECSP